MAKLSAFRHFLRDAVGIDSKEAARYVREVRNTGIDSEGREKELINHLTAKFNAGGGEHWDKNISDEVMRALGTQNQTGIGLGKRVYDAGARAVVKGPSPQSQRDLILEKWQSHGHQKFPFSGGTSSGATGGKSTPPPRQTPIQDIFTHAQTVQRSRENIQGATQRGQKVREEYLTQSGGYGLDDATLDRIDAQAAKEEQAAAARKAQEEKAAAEKSRKETEEMEAAYKEEVAEGALGDTATVADPSVPVSELGQKSTPPPRNSSAFASSSAPSSGPNAFQQKTTDAVSGGTFDASKYVTEPKDSSWLQKNAYGRMNKRVTEELENFRAQAQGATDQAAFDEVMKKHGLEGATQENFMEKAYEHYGQQLKNGPTGMDYFRGNHGVGISLGVVGGATVLNLASSRGRKSNNDLYSDPFR